jgi:hypothetical protein
MDLAVHDVADQSAAQDLVGSPIKGRAAISIVDKDVCPCRLRRFDHFLGIRDRRCHRFLLQDVRHTSPDRCDHRFLVQWVRCSDHNEVQVVLRQHTRVIGVRLGASGHSDRLCLVTPDVCHGSNLNLWMSRQELDVLAPQDP